uniref:SWIM-type domain-containing protein n=1 Tax=Strongyloides papillosus TaxID=174720 RepID=A0A0N5C9L5_STREA
MLPKSTDTIKNCQNVVKNKRGRPKGIKNKIIGKTICKKPIQKKSTSCGDLLSYNCSSIRSDEILNDENERALVPSVQKIDQVQVQKDTIFRGYDITESPSNTLQCKHNYNFVLNGFYHILANLNESLNNISNGNNENSPFYKNIIDRFLNPKNSTDNRSNKENSLNSSDRTPSNGSSSICSSPPRIISTYQYRKNETKYLLMSNCRSYESYEEFLENYDNQNMRINKVTKDKDGNVISAMLICRKSSDCRYKILLKKHVSLAENQSTDLQFPTISNIKEVYCEFVSDIEPHLHDGISEDTYFHKAKKCCLSSTQLNFVTSLRKETNLPLSKIVKLGRENEDVQLPKNYSVRQIRNKIKYVKHKQEVNDPSCSLLTFCDLMIFCKKFIPFHLINEINEKKCNKDGINFIPVGEETNPNEINPAYIYDCSTQNNYENIINRYDDFIEIENERCDMLESGNVSKSSKILIDSKKMKDFLVSESNDHKPYCYSFMFHETVSRSCFSIFFSTPTLMKILQSKTIFSIDATFKISDTDMKTIQIVVRHGDSYIPAGIIIATNESFDALDHIFYALHNVYKVSQNLRIMVADFANCYTLLSNGGGSTDISNNRYNKFLRGGCIFHFKTSVFKNKTFKSLSPFYQSQAKLFVNCFCNAVNRDCAISLIKNFKNFINGVTNKDEQNHLEEFHSYILKEFFLKNNENMIIYSKYLYGMSTNNGTEGLNSFLKRFNDYKRLPLNDSLYALLGYVSINSEKIIDIQRSTSLITDFKKKQIKKAEEYAYKKQYVKKVFGSQVIYLFPKNVCDLNVIDENISKYTNTNSTFTLDEYDVFIKSVNISTMLTIERIDKTKNHIQYCDCSIYRNHKYCSHSFFVSENEKGNYNNLIIPVNPSQKKSRKRNNKGWCDH